MRLRIGHSPDPDDAFMAWALAEGVVRDPAFEVEVVARDIQSLNQLALEGRGLDVTALSAAAYAQVTDEYLLLPFGASFGEGYGPIVVAAQPLDPEDLPFLHVAGPGRHTTASHALKMALGAHLSLDHVGFEDVMPGVKHGLFDAGLVIHEGQLTYEREGLVKVFDLGEWWAREEPGLPFPLGVIAIRRDIGEDLLPRAVALVERALHAALQNRETALAYASKFGRGLPQEDVDRFVEMYVTGLTRDMRPGGAKAVERFVQRMVQSRAVDGDVRVEFAPAPEHPHPQTLARAEQVAVPVQADDPEVVAALQPEEAPAEPTPSPKRKAPSRKKVARKKATPKKAASRKATPSRATKKASAKKAARKPAKKASAKKATAKAATKKPAKKARKSPAKKAAKKPSAKATTKKAAAKKSTKRSRGRS